MVTDINKSRFLQEQQIYNFNKTALLPALKSTVHDKSG